MLKAALIVYAYCVAGIGLSPPHVFGNLKLTRTQFGRCYPHFTDKGTEAREAFKSH